jgi:hypothetical protein
MQFGPKELVFAAFCLLAASAFDTQATMAEG